MVEAGWCSVAARPCLMPEVSKRQRIWIAVETCQSTCDARGPEIANSGTCHPYSRVQWPHRDSPSAVVGMVMAMLCGRIRQAAPR